MNRYLICMRWNEDLVPIELTTLDDFLDTPLAVMPLYSLDYLIISPFNIV